MTADRKEDWIQITTPEGKKMIAAPSYIKKLLGLSSRDQLLAGVFSRLVRLERKVDHLEAPGRQKKIIKLLQENGKHSRVWIMNRVSNYQGCDLRGLVQEGLIVESKSGNTPMYSCPEGSQ